MLGTVPLPDLRAEAALVHRAHGQHDMGMGLGHAVFADVPMDIEIGDHAPVHEFGLHEVAGEFDALACVISRGMANSTSRASCASFLTSKASTSFHSRSRSLHASGAFSGSMHLGMYDAALGGEIMAALEPLVAQPRGRAVGGRRHRAGAGCAANDFDVKMIDRHRDQIIYTAQGTSERRISAPSLEKFSGGTTPSPTVPPTLQHSCTVFNYHHRIDNLTDGLE